MKSSIKAQVLESKPDSGWLRAWKRNVQGGHFILTLTIPSSMNEYGNQAVLGRAPGRYWPNCWTADQWKRSDSQCRV